MPQTARIDSLIPRASTVKRTDAGVTEELFKRERIAIGADARRVVFVDLIARYGPGYQICFVVRRAGQIIAQGNTESQAMATARRALRHGQ